MLICFSLSSSIIFVTVFIIVMFVSVSVHFHRQHRNMFMFETKEAPNTHQLEGIQKESEYWYMRTAHYTRQSNRSQLTFGGYCWASFSSHQQCFSFRKRSTATPRNLKCYWTLCTHTYQTRRDARTKLFENKRSIWRRSIFHVYFQTHVWMRERKMLFGHRTARTVPIRAAAAAAASSFIFTLNISQAQSQTNQKCSTNPKDHLI